jgi:hypothetical protein
MTKSETRELNKLIANAPALGLDWFAMGLSTLIRSTLSGKTRMELKEVAFRHRAHLSTEYII